MSNRGLPCPDFRTTSRKEWSIYSIATAVEGAIRPRIEVVAARDNQDQVSASFPNAMAVGIANADTGTGTTEKGTVCVSLQGATHRQSPAGLDHV
jgi:hypothetical protein